VEIALRLLYWVQVLSLDIFDEGDFKEFGIGCGTDDGRDFWEADLNRGAPSPFTGDEFKVVLLLTDENGLEDAFLLYGVGEFDERVGVHVGSRLVRVRSYIIDVDKGHFAGDNFRAGLPIG